MFNHSNIGLNKKLDRLLRVVVVTPDMHRVHHSTKPYKTHTNFGFNLPWWDKLFQTYEVRHLEQNHPMGVSHFKETKTSENRKNSVEELKRKKFNTADYSQYLSKNEKFAFFNESCLDYITSLRGYSDHNKNNSTDKERFSSIPARNRTNYPTFLKKVTHFLSSNLLKKQKQSKSKMKNQV